MNMLESTQHVKNLTKNVTFWYNLETICGSIFIL